MARRSGNLRRRTTTGGKALYGRSALCSISGINQYQLDLWEREDLVVPAEIVASGGRREPLYDQAALERIRVIRILSEDLEVNLPGISIILNLLDRMSR